MPDEPASPTGAAPTPVAAPAVPAPPQPAQGAATPAPAPQPARPDWLYQQQEPPAAPPPQLRQPPMPMQPPAQPVAPPQPSPLDRWLDNPDQMAQGAVAQGLAPLLLSQIQMRQQLERMQQIAVGRELAATNAAIEGHYENVFNKSSAFGNPEVKRLAEQALQEHNRNARARAEQGDFSLLQQEQDPMFAELILYASMKKAGYPAGAVPQGLALGQAFVEGARTPAAETPIVIDSDTREAWRRAGISEEEGMAALKSRRERGWEDLV